MMEVSGGLARVLSKPTDVEVEVIDLDQLREGAYEDIQHYWNNSLSARARRYVRTKYPDVARRVQA
jgi:hypothetical protein